MKFSYAHFPKGTVFEIGELATRLTDSQTQHEVESLYSVYPGTYVINTTSFIEREYPIYNDDNTPSGETRKERTQVCLNIDHVTKIIKRGAGSVVFEAEPEPLAKWSIPVSKPSRSSYIGYENVCPFSDVILSLVEKQLHTKHDSWVDMNRLTLYVLAHGAIRRKANGINDPFTGDQMAIRKRKLKSIIRRNLNRFLIPIREAEAEYLRERDNDYARDDLFWFQHDVVDEVDQDDSADDGLFGHALDERFALSSDDLHEDERKI